MLYKKIHFVGLAIYATLSRTTFGAEYVAYADKSSDGCFGATSSDSCLFYCNKKDWNQDFDCGNAGICNISCDQKKCFELSTITATNSTQLNVDAGTAQNCYLTTTFHLPAFGNAYFNDDNDCDDPYQYITINAGTNTQDIYINCAGDDGKDQCTSMTINATSAQRLHIDVANGKLVGADVSDMVNIYCPYSTSYGGVNGAPCYINANTLDNVNIHTLNGIPYDLWIDIDDEKNLKNVILTCVDLSSGAAISGKNIMKLTTKDNDCYNTRSPTTAAPTPPTIDPTNVPTVSPTQTTQIPTNYPSLNPSQTPTLQPTLGPTKYPSLPPTHATKDPSANPTKFPTLAPTKAPSVNPTKYPTRNPTVSPTKNPSIPQTKFPTNNPSISPTKTPSIPPTKYPTRNPSTRIPSIPTNAPSAAPTNAPTETTNPPTETPQMSTTPLNDDLMGGSQADNDDLTSFLILVIGPIIVVILALIACVALCSWYRKKRKVEVQNAMRIASISQNAKKTQDSDLLQTETYPGQQAVSSNIYGTSFASQAGYNQQSDLLQTQANPGQQTAFTNIYGASFASQPGYNHTQNTNIYGTSFASQPVYNHTQNDIVALAEVAQEGNHVAEGDDLHDSDDDVIDGINETQEGPANVFAADDSDDDDIIDDINITQGGPVNIIASDDSDDDDILKEVNATAGGPNNNANNSDNVDVQNEEQDMELFGDDEFIEQGNEMVTMGRF